MIVEGCIDELALNFDENANTDDGSCIPLVNGCTDELAFNYDETANTDDGSCVISGCTDDGQQSWSVNPGTPACNYDSAANLNDGSCTYPLTYYDCNNICINDTDGDGVCDELEVLGCTCLLYTSPSPRDS